eukprot:XP_024447735.1 transmembrane emp24 domain-containing protein p24delta7-like [Populus trichocarpa]
MSKSNLLMITTLGLIFTIAESMRFDLQSGHTKCISEDIMNNAVTVGKYNVVNPNEGYPLPVSHKVTVRVISQFHSLKPSFCFVEEEMQHLNQSTNSKMAGLSFLSIVVCLSVAGLQLWHLKSYFERKKLL